MVQRTPAPSRARTRDAVRRVRRRTASRAKDRSLRNASHPLPRRRSTPSRSSTRQRGVRKCIPESTARCQLRSCAQLAEPRDRPAIRRAPGPIRDNPGLPCTIVIDVQGRWAGTRDRDSLGMSRLPVPVHFGGSGGASQVPGEPAAYVPCSQTPVGSPGPGHYDPHGCCLPHSRRRRPPHSFALGAQSHGPHARCLRFAARGCPRPRKTRFRLPGQAWPDGTSYPRGSKWGFVRS